MRIAITGGGTGGHLSIVKSLAIECKNRGFYIMYIGSTRGQDRQWFSEDDMFDKSIFLESKPIVNQHILHKCSNLYKILLESIRVKKAMQEANIQACISVGGFSAATGGFGAIFGAIPLFIHEQNAYMGALNRLLSPFAREIFSSFEFNKKNATLTPYPISRVFFHRRRTRVALKNIAFLGGSQGASAINDFALSIAPELKERNIKILHQTGKIEYEKVTMAYKHMGFKIAKDLEEFIKEDYAILVFDFSTVLHDIMCVADFCVSRSGASSLWELVANGLPTLFIPYPYAAKNHQYFNAKILKDKDLCLLSLQHDIQDNKVAVLQDIFSLDLESISNRLIAYNFGNEGSKAIIDFIESILSKT